MVETVSPVVLVVGADAKRLQWMTHHITSQWPESVVSSIPLAQAHALGTYIADPAPDAIFFHIDFGSESALPETPIN